jgi:hypothetical protein
MLPVWRLRPRVRSVSPPRLPPVTRPSHGPVRREWGHGATAPFAPEGDRHLSAPLEPVGKTDFYPGPVMIGYDILNLNCTNGAVIGVGALPVNSSVICMDVLPMNGLTLSHGVPVVGPKLSLNASGMALSVGGPLGARIELSPTGLTLAFGPPGLGASVVLDATGVTLKFGPTNQVQLGPQGVTVQGLQVGLQALTSLQVQALQLTETVAGPVARTGAATTML